MVRSFYDVEDGSVLVELNQSRGFEQWTVRGSDETRLEIGYTFAQKHEKTILDRKRLPAWITLA